METSRLWRETVRHGKRLSSFGFSMNLLMPYDAISAMAQFYDVLITENLFGDIFNR
jgi:isocitrate/isopropylmalate dehydrogenase